MSIEPHSANRRRRRVKLIFNPSAGAARGTKIEIQDVIHELQAWQFEPEAYLVEPGCDLSEVVRNALAQGIRLFVVCGGDGTHSCGRRSLGWARVPPWGSSPSARRTTWPSAWASRKTCRPPSPFCARAVASRWTWARPQPVRLCSPSCWLAWWGWRRPFSRRPTISSTANLARIGDFLAALIASPPADMHLVLDDKQEIHTQGHVAAGLQHALHRLAFSGWRR